MAFMSLEKSLTSAMPTYIYILYEDKDAGHIWDLLASQFRRNSSPSWFLDMPETLQAYFMTRWMAGIADRSDIHGTSLTSMRALQPTTINDSPPTTVVAEEVMVYASIIGFLLQPVSLTNATQGIS